MDLHCDCAQWLSLRSAGGAYPPLPAADLWARIPTIAFGQLALYLEASRGRTRKHPCVRLSVDLVPCMHRLDSHAYGHRRRQSLGHLCLAHQSSRRLSKKTQPLVW